MSVRVKPLRPQTIVVVVVVTAALAYGAWVRAGVFPSRAPPLRLAPVGDDWPRPRIDVDPPHARPELSKAFAQRLARMGCGIPRGPLPAIARGEFAARGQIDTAVVCVIGDASTIAVDFAGPAACPVVVAGLNDDRHFAEVWSRGGPPILARHVERFDRSHEHADIYERRLGEHPLRHDAVFDWHDTVRSYAFHYCSDGMWLSAIGGGE